MASAVLANARLPRAARVEAARDQKGLPVDDPGIETIEQATIDWLCEAQDRSTSNDGGIARHFSLVDGWSSSYPETTGYIVPTLIDFGERSNRPDVVARARKASDWLVSIQFPEGGFQGGVIGASPRVPVTFNTGQILLGLAAATSRFGADFATPMRKAANWLVDTIDDDGCWRRFPTPFAAAGEKAYETHVSWGLIEAARTVGSPTDAERYASTALRNARWAIAQQQPSGWFGKNCLENPDAPLTHTIGYVLRGLVEIGAYTRAADVLDASRKCADGIAGAVQQDGYLGGRLDRSWRSAVPWVCLTGSAQIAHAFIRLEELGEGGGRLLSPARRLLQYVRRSVRTDGPADTRGGVKGSFPVDGAYGRYQYLNWAAKFLHDACAAERAWTDRGSAAPTGAR